jgi:single-stranded DNA-binding protein
MPCTDANGEKVNTPTGTPWRCGEMAETVFQYCSKGKLVCVEGLADRPLRESNGETKYWNKIVASQVSFSAATRR